MTPPILAAAVLRALPGVPRLDRSWGAIRHPGDAVDYFRVPARPAFRPGAPGFDAVNAWWLGELSGLIYRRDREEQSPRNRRPSRAQVLEAVGLEEAAVIHRGGIHCTVVRPKGAAPAYAVVVFRGTTGLRSGVRALDLRSSRGPAGGLVHRGFHTALGLIWPDLRICLQSFPGPWFYTGHSLGGALAMLAAAHHPARAVYTFGAPRVGDTGFLQSLALQATFALVNPRDPVPALPPPTAHMTLAPLAPLYRFCGRGHLHGPHAGHAAPVLGPRERRASPAADLRLGPPEWLTDHAPANYRVRLAGLLPPRASHP
jgi:triacylglycerol lipase